jgi:hypothetical protein
LRNYRARRKFAIQASICIRLTKASPTQREVLRASRLSGPFAGIHGTARLRHRNVTEEPNIERLADHAPNFADTL